MWCYIWKHKTGGNKMGGIKSIDNLFMKTTDSKQVHECILYIEDSNGKLSYKNSYGGKDINSPFLMPV